MHPDPGFETLSTERLLLRRSVVADADAIAAYRSDPDVSRYQGWDRTDVDGIRTEIEEMGRRVPGQPGGWVQLSVELRSDPGGVLVGDVGLAPSDGEPGVIKVGYTIAPEFQGRGYATEAIAALVDYAFDVLEADVVRAFASGLNVPSHRVAEKVGMRLVERFEGVHNGVAWSGVRYERNREASA